MASRLPADVRLLNKKYREESVLTAKGRKYLKKTVLKAMFTRATVVKLFPYLVKNTCAMLGKKRLLPDKLLWRVLSDGGMVLPEEYDLALSYLEGGAAYFVADHVKAAKKAAFIHVDYEIYYPNNHYVSEFNDIGYAVSEHIAGYLSEMGIYRNGLYTRDSDGEEDDDTNWYPDGSRADYYSVIRNSKYNGVPGIIVEHAYLSDAGDTHVFLSNDNMLVRMGQADASGIADYFGLHKKNGLCTEPKFG